MSEEDTIQVNFARPMALFPLDQVTLLPQQVLPLHIFEPRYRQMIDLAIDGSGQVAMAVFQGGTWRQEYHARPPIRGAVCVGQMVQHERLADGRYNIVLRGVCRARVLREMPPREGVLFREAMLEPLGLNQDETPMLAVVRNRLEQALEHGPLRALRESGALLEYVRDEEIPTAALLELVSFSLISDRETRYRLLEESESDARAGIIESELRSLGRVLRIARAQRRADQPRGVSLN